MIRTGRRDERTPAMRTPLKAALVLAVAGSLLLAACGSAASDGSGGSGGGAGTTVTTAE